MWERKRVSEYEHGGKKTFQKEMEDDVMRDHYRVRTVQSATSSLMFWMLSPLKAKFFYK